MINVCHIIIKVIDLKMTRHENLSTPWAIDEDPNKWVQIYLDRMNNFLKRHRIDLSASDDAASGCCGWARVGEWKWGKMRRFWLFDERTSMAIFHRGKRMLWSARNTCCMLGAPSQPVDAVHERNLVDPVWVIRLRRRRRSGFVDLLLMINRLANDDDDEADDNNAKCGGDVHIIQWRGVGPSCEQHQVRLASIKWTWRCLELEKGGSKAPGDWLVGLGAI